MAEINTTWIPVETPVANSAPENINTVSNEILKTGLDTQAGIDNIWAPDEIALQSNILEAQVLKDQANQLQDLNTNSLDILDKNQSESIAAWTALIEAQRDVDIQTQKTNIKVAEFNLDSQESLNQQQIDAADVLRQRAQEDLIQQQDRQNEQREELIKRQERNVAAQRAAAAVRAHMSGMSFSGAGQDYISRTVENAASDMESVIQTFDFNSEAQITQLRRNRDDFEVKYMDTISAGETQMRALRLEYETAVDSIPGIINMSDAQKKLAIAEINEAARNQKLQIERDTMNDISSNHSQQITNFRNFWESLKARQATYLQEFNDTVNNWTFNSLSNSQLQEMSSKTGLSVSDLKQRASAAAMNGIASAITASGRTLTLAQSQALQNQYSGYIAQGFTPTQALSFVSSQLKEVDTSGFLNSVATGSFFSASLERKAELAAQSGLSIAEMEAQALSATNGIFDNAILQLNPDASGSQLQELRGNYEALIRDGNTASTALAQLIPEFNALPKAKKDELTDDFGSLLSWWETVEAPGWYLDNLWDGNKANRHYWWAYDNGWFADKPGRGLDIDWQVWDPIFIPLSWTVLSTSTTGPFGNSMVIELPDKKKIRYSHLDSMLAKEWATITPNQKFATLWNTGNVLTTGGRTPTASELARWVWSHIDIVIQNEDGTYMTAVEVESYLEKLSSPNLVNDVQFDDLASSEDELFIPTGWNVPIEKDDWFNPFIPALIQPFLKQ